MAVQSRDNPTHQQEAKAERGQTAPPLPLTPLHQGNHLKGLFTVGKRLLSLLKNMKALTDLHKGMS